MNKILHELPIDVEERYKILQQRFAGEEDRYIRYLSELSSVRYLVDQPIFVNYYLKEEKILSQSVSCMTLRLEDVKTSPFPKCFVLYGFSSQNGITYVRGAYIDYDGVAYRKMREEKIDKIIE
jgi:hypothetical protein